MPIFTGDVFLDKPYQLPFGPRTELIINLEYPISSRGKPVKNKVNLKQNKSFLKETFKNSIIGVNLANNHIMDFGVEALEDTLSTLENLNLSYFGVGSEENNFHNPLIIRRENQKFALFGYCCKSTNGVLGQNDAIGACPLVEEKVINDITKYKAQGYYVILNIHWGQEEIPFPKPNDVTIARNFIDNGADLIIGHHAHVIQSYEIYNTKHIFYGLGNFIFPDLVSPSMYDGSKFTAKYIKHQYSWNRKSLLVDVDIDVTSIKTANLNGNKISVSTKPSTNYPIFEDDELWKHHVAQTRLKKKIRRLFEKPAHNISVLFKKLTGAK